MICRCYTDNILEDCKNYPGKPIGAPASDARRNASTQYLPEILSTMFDMDKAKISDCRAYSEADF